MNRYAFLPKWDAVPYNERPVGYRLYLWDRMKRRVIR